MKKIETIVDDKKITLSRERWLWVIPAIRETISQGERSSISYLYIKGSPEYSILNSKLKNN